jgi:hypothetical protein
MGQPPLKRPHERLQGGCEDNISQELKKSGCFSVHDLLRRNERPIFNFPSQRPHSRKG